MFSFSQISLIGDHLSKNGDNDNNTNSCNRDSSDNDNEKFSFFCSSLFQVFFKFRIFLGHPFSFDVYHYLIAFLRYHYSYHFVISCNIRKSLRWKRKRKGKPHVQDLS